MALRHPADPIVAVATANGRGAVGIVRVSARSLASLAAAVCGRLPSPRVATLMAFVDADGRAIDRGLALWFPAPHSYTGEDVLELHAHGGPVVLQLLVERCLEAAATTGPDGRPVLAHLRLAEPGEFTERAYLNDKLDLAQAEAVADLIDAGTATAARSAARSLDGEFSRRVDALTATLVELRTLVEATLDFPDEDVDFIAAYDARGRLARAAAELDAVLAQARQGALLREGLRVVIAGQPNAGKSSLLNALAGAELAIVTPVPGTTRDKVGETLQIDGVPIHIVDTAGLREATDDVERIGIARSWSAIEGADAVVFVHDLTRVGDATYDDDEARIAERLVTAAIRGDRIVHVFNKVDAARLTSAAFGDDDIAISALTGEGLDRVRRRLLEVAGWQPAGEGLFTARARHVEALRRARDHLTTAGLHARADDPALELFAEELRLAHDALAEITGAFSSDDLLGAIFGRFCIGK